MTPECRALHARRRGAAAGNSAVTASRSSCSVWVVGLWTGQPYVREHEAASGAMATSTRP